MGQNPRMNEQDVRLAKQQIQAVLARSPEAADTVEGIHGWWLASPEPRPHWTATEEALQQLQREGVVESVTLEDGRVVWRAKRP